MVQDKSIEKSNRQPKWDLYEAVILLNGYLEALDKKIPKLRIVKQVSTDLRQMAVNKGTVIDDVFRNENGISYQIKSMGSAFAGHKIYIPATKLFLETVNMYRNDRQQYEKILKEAKDLTAPTQSNRDAFLAWSTSEACVSSNKWTENNLNLIGVYGNKACIISGSIFDITDADVLERLFRSVLKSKIFQITNKRIYKHILQDLQTYRYFCENKAAILSEMQYQKSEKVAGVDTMVSDENHTVSETQDNGEILSDTFQVNFSPIGNFAFTQPISLTYNGKNYACKKWKNLYVVLLKVLYQMFKAKFDAIKDTETFRSDDLMICTALKVDTFRIATEIADGLYVETNHSATTIVNNIKSFLDLCNVSYDDVAITYMKRGKSASQSKPQEAISRETSVAKYSQELLDVAETVIATSFVNGMRKNATIAKKKFRNVYLELTGNEIPENIDIDDLASYVGVEYSDKIYAVSEESKQRIKEFIQAAVEVGNRVMFYEEVYQKNIDFMTNAGIFSSDLLKIVLKQILPRLCYNRASFSPDDSDSLEQDIVTCYDDKLMLTYGEIKNMLPYADMYQIRLVCSRNSKFVWAKEQTYALAEKLHLSPVDIKESKRIIAYDIKKQGFSVFQRVTALESTELNPSVPEVAVKEAIYALHLSVDYERNRSIITLTGASFSPSSVMAEYCKSLKDAMLSELQSYEEDLTNKTSYSLGAAYSYMIRVEKERFVSVDSLSFDVQAIDNALALFVRDKIIPLKSVNSFTSFPEVVEYTWNLFMLDSYCQHFSMRFRSMGGPAKSRPVGAIFPTQMQFASYDDLLAQVAAKSDLKLNADDVSKFFTDNAYTLRKIDTNGIIAKAQEIRIQED